MSLIQLPCVAAARKQKKIPRGMHSPLGPGRVEEGAAEQGRPLGILLVLQSGPERALSSQPLCPL